MCWLDHHWVTTGITRVPPQVSYLVNPATRLIIVAITTVPNR
jgi:hypothetical protein